MRARRATCQRGARVAAGRGRNDFDAQLARFGDDDYTRAVFERRGRIAPVIFDVQIFQPQLRAEVLGMIQRRPTDLKGGGGGGGGTRRQTKKPTKEMSA